MNSLARVGIHVALAVTFLLTVSACLPPDMPPSGLPARITGTPAPVACGNFAESNWKEFRFGVDSPEDVVATVRRLWDYDETQVEVIAPAQDQPGLVRPHRQVDWKSQDGGARYHAYFLKGEPLQRVKFIMKRQTTLEQVIECLGFPEYYSAYYIPDIEDADFRLDLWYMDKGLVITHGSWYGAHDVPLWPIPPGLVMTSGQAVPSSDPAAMISAAYHWSSPGQPEYILCVLRPWPGSLEAIEIETTYPSLTQCYEPM